MAAEWVYRPSGLKPALDHDSVYFLVLTCLLLNRKLQFSRSLSSLIQCQTVLKCWGISLLLVPIIEVNGCRSLFRRTGDIMILYWGDYLLAPGYPSSFLIMV